MKIKILVHAVIAIALSSCVTTKQFEKPFDNEKVHGRSSPNETFIIKINGEKIIGNKIVHRGKAYDERTVHKNWIAIDGQKIMEKDFYAYQHKEGYYMYYKPLNRIPFFIPRIRQGKINLYYYEHAPLGPNQNDVRGAYHVYVFEKEAGKLEELTFASFSSAIGDNPEALGKFRQLYPNSKIPLFNEKENLRNLTSVVELYNK